jgi:hypothetical protein
LLVVDEAHHRAVVDAVAVSAALPDAETVAKILSRPAVANSPVVIRGLL